MLSEAKTANPVKTEALVRLVRGRYRPDDQQRDRVDALMGLVRRRNRSADQHALDLRNCPPQAASRQDGTSPART